MPAANTIDGILAKFVMPVTESGCWIWMGCDDGQGYGAVTFRGKRWLAHRLIYIAFNGPVPDGLELDHLCHVRCCVNPKHLEPVTRLINSHRGDKYNKLKCGNGHELTPQNLTIHPDGTRHCRACARDHQGWKGGLPTRERTHCPQGHEYSRIDNLGRRVCGICHLAASRRYHARKKERLDGVAQQK